MPLPTSPVRNTVEDMTPDRLRAILYGYPGAGKTTLAAGWFPKTNLIIDLEGGTRFLPGDHFIEKPVTYTDFMRIVHELCTTKHPFTTVTIDTGDALFRMADTEAGLRGGKVAAGLVEYGKGTSDRDATVLRELGRLLRETDLGVILCAHPAEETIEVNGKQTTLVEPLGDLAKKVRQEILGRFDYTLFVRKSDHMIVTGGDPGVETKRRPGLPDTLSADAGQLYSAIKKSVESITKTKEVAA